MAVSWSLRRKGLYSAVAVVIGIIVVVYGYETFFTSIPTCTDGVMNGDEHGVDCGGNTCSLLCRSEAQAPKVLWSRVFAAGEGVYTAAAYIQNDNNGSGAKNVAYSFQLFDSNNSLIIERDGVVDLPPVQTTPIVEVNIPLPNRTPSRVLFGFSGVPTWQRIPASKVPKLHITGQQLAVDASSLEATLVNDGTTDARNVTVAAVLFDASGTARAASKSTVSVSKKSSTPVVFTFAGGVPDIVRAELTVLPQF